MKTNVRSISVSFYTGDCRFETIDVLRNDEREQLNIACHTYHKVTAARKARIMRVASAWVASKPGGV